MPARTTNATMAMSAPTLTAQSVLGNPAAISENGLQAAQLATLPSAIQDSTVARAASMIAPQASSVRVESLLRKNVQLAATGLTKEAHSSMTPTARPAMPALHARSKAARPRQQSAVLAISAPPRRRLRPQEISATTTCRLMEVRRQHATSRAVTLLALTTVAFPMMRRKAGALQCQPSRACAHKASTARRA